MDEWGKRMREIRGFGAKKCSSGQNSLNSFSKSKNVCFFCYNLP